jgi:hypothetical protein
MPGEETPMPVKCPGCNLLFGTRNELDWHVREEHTRSRLPDTTPTGDEATSAGRTTPVTVAAHADPDGEAGSPDPSEPSPAETETGSQRGRARRLFRRSRTSPRSATLSDPPPSDERR